MLGFETVIASATTNIAKIASAILLENRRSKILNNLVVFGKILKVRHQLSINRAATEYVHKYFNRYGVNRFLGKVQPTLLKSVYIPIQVWQEYDIQQCDSLENLTNIISQGKIRRGQFVYHNKIDGIAAVNQSQYLMVLGEDGIGKSTFLRHIALEVLQGKKFGTIFDSTYIPVLIDLKEVIQLKGSIEKFILAEFVTCKFPFPEKLTQKALSKGSLFILLDGLNEVPKSEIKNIIFQIKNLIKVYPQNRFIISCRTNYYQDNLDTFTKVLISHFEESQIERFLCNWFHADTEELNLTALSCWESLQKPENSQAQKLAQNTLCLALLCLVYEHHQSFPQTLYALYQEAWQILLASGLSDPRLQLTADQKSIMGEKLTDLLGEIAFINFEKNQPFFENQFILDLFNNFIKTNLPENNDLVANLLMNVIAINTGILVSRSTNLFTFSQSILSEYLTVEYVFKNDKIEELVTNYINQISWQTIFLLLAKKMSCAADKLLLKMEIAAQQYITTPKLQALLNWADQITAEAEGNIKPAAKRATAILISGADFVYPQEASKTVGEKYKLPFKLEEDFNLSQDFMVKMSSERIFAIDLAYLLELDIGLILARSRILANNITDTIGLARSRIFANQTARELAETTLKFRGRLLDLDFSFAMNHNRDLAIDRTRDLALVCILAREYEKLKFSQKNNQFIAELEALQEFIPGNNEPLENHQLFRNRIQETWLKTFNINPDLVNLSLAEKMSLGNYLYINCLMVQCYQAAAEVSPEIWQAIEERMLLIGND